VPESKEKSEVVATEADVDWAYGVLSAAKEAIDKATGDEEATRQLMKEVVEEMPNILEAMVILVEEEHRGLVGGLITSTVRWVRTWQTK